MTKKQLIALFEAMEENCMACARFAESDGNHSLSRYERGQASAFATAANILKSNKYAKETAEIFEAAC